jgi:hypothetical protein
MVRFYFLIYERKAEPEIFHLIYFFKSMRLDKNVNVACTLELGEKPRSGLGQD